MYSSNYPIKDPWDTKLLSEASSLKEKLDKVRLDQLTPFVGGYLYVSSKQHPDDILQYEVVKIDRSSSSILLKLVPSIDDCVYYVKSFEVLDTGYISNLKGEFQPWIGVAQIYMIPKENK